MRAKSKIRSNRIDELVDGFDGYVEAFDRSVPFTKSGQWEHHRRTIDLWRDLGDVASAVEDPRFVQSLWDTLRAWGIGVRASRLVDAEALGIELRRWRSQFAELDGVALGSAPPAFRSKIWALASHVDIIENQARLVALTKTLHHLLPDLVVPIDRAYTGQFFDWNMNDFQNEQQKVFDVSWQAFQYISQQVKPERFVGDGWRTSTTKIIDNAIVGYCIENGLANGQPPVLRHKPSAATKPSPGAPRRVTWTADDLRQDLEDFERELRAIGMKPNTIQTYIGRADTFLRWLEGRYTPRGPNA